MLTLVLPFLATKGLRVLEERVNEAQVDQKLHSTTLIKDSLCNKVDQSLLTIQMVLVM